MAEKILNVASEVANLSIDKILIELNPEPLNSSEVISVINRPNSSFNKL